ncbi:AMP-binding protein [Jeotgalibacillus haloalkalitolerans]|uniref:AMP-binding protein n=1 Tax=Jeotgalibacillus haloalkalitolerans TaxID=3104292 RepID=A0ABU5KHS4_9BACL|nr:AMP-binding protein [Jeotgalibacillus sp. HH7-29]MDZ5710725.1 AMP-binding protein [Jeotgalibacillus sp. HH7-29]
MLYIDDQFYSQADLDKRFEIFRGMPELRENEGKRIAVCLDDPFEWIALCLFMKQSGGTVMPIHASTPKDGAVQMANRASCTVLFYGVLDSPLYLENESADEEGGLLQMSSGTTGAPKCIKRSWGSIDEELESYVKVLPAGSDVPSLVACPVSHSYGLICGVLASLARGAQPVILSGMNPAYLLKKVKAHQKHLFYASPVLLHTMARLARGEKVFDQVMTSGTMLPSVWFEKIKEVSGTVLQQYGCSEAGCISINPDVTSTGEMGYVLPHLEVTAGLPGHPQEIVVTKKEEVIHTKDLGELDHGMLTFISRLDDTINVAGLNVYPQEVEDVLLRASGVNDAVVLKKPSRLSGENVCAYYNSTEELAESELREWCLRYLAPYQIPATFMKVNEIPKLANGKVSRKQVSELFV